MARGDDGAIARFAATIGLAEFPRQVPLNGQTVSKSALQYLENHDHSRFLADFGTVQRDEASNYLFLVADRDRWFKVQPYLIALLTGMGVPMLFQGQELAEDFTLPGNGLGRISLLRPVNWDYFYDDAGRAMVTLVRRLLRLRRNRPELRSGDHWYFADWDHQSSGVMVFRRTLDARSTVVAVNFTDRDADITVAFPAPGAWLDQLRPGQVVANGQPVKLTVPSNYGRVWTLQ